MMRTTDFSRIYASAPLNGTAACVTSNSRQHWTPKLSGQCEHWENPPPCVPPHQYPVADSFEDLRGVRAGLFTVVGFLGKPEGKSKKKKPTWLLKCACGSYEARTAKAIRENRDPEARCQACDYQRRLREGYVGKVA